MSTIMSSSELCSDAYRFYRSIDHDSNGTRSKTIAKVEPYLISTNEDRTVQSLSPSNIITMPTMHMAPSTKARIVFNSVETCSSSSSAMSLAGMTGHTNVCQSDFLVPHPAHSIRSCPAQSRHHICSNLPDVAIARVTPSTLLLSESLVHGSSSRLPSIDTSLCKNEQHRNSLTSPGQYSQVKYRSLAAHEFPTSLVRVCLSSVSRP
jgi:hypothetical protein